MCPKGEALHPTIRECVPVEHVPTCDLSSPHPSNYECTNVTGKVMLPRPGKLKTILHTLSVFSKKKVKIKLCFCSRRLPAL